MNSSKQSAKQTLVEEGTEFTGTLTSRCEVVVNGRIDGEVRAPELRVTESGVVLGTIKANKLRSEGILAGSIDADDVYLSGTVRSNTVIRASKLEVKLAAEQGKLEVMFGECLLEVGTDPALEQGREPEAVRAVLDAGPSMAAAGASDTGSPRSEASSEALRSAATEAFAQPQVVDNTAKDANGHRAGRQGTERRDSQVPST